MAIFHDYLKVLGGAERSVLCMAKSLNADVITTNYNSHVLDVVEDRHPRIINLGYLARNDPLQKIQACLLFQGADFPDYDFYIFSGNWCCVAGKAHTPNLYYCHHPVRMFYDLKERILSELEWYGRAYMRPWIYLHSIWDRTSVRRMKMIATNSENVRNRIRKYYDRDAVVIYGPVPTRKYRFDEVGDYWLSVNRVHPEKRVDLQIEIFRQLPEEKLVIVGDTERDKGSRLVMAKLKVPPNVKLVGEVDQRELENLYAGCKGFITTALDEDFGLTPIEAMASGKAVLATNEGGYRETVVDNETGWLLPADVNAFARKIRSLTVENLTALKEKCFARAALFDESKFLERIRNLMSRVQENCSDAH